MTPDLSWQRDALCAPSERHPDMWFPERRGTRDAKRARAFCAVCPVQQQCLAKALADPDTRGIWGGTNDADRAILRAKGQSSHV